MFPISESGVGPESWGDWILNWSSKKWGDLQQGVGGDREWLLMNVGFLLGGGCKCSTIDCADSCMLSVTILKAI